ncbi:hypothetical protein FIBSPDRAFT_679113, partial [Athelia psychrophila]
PARVQRVLDLIEIGDDLTLDEKREIIRTIVDYADVFALSVAEVTPVKGAKVHQRSLKGPERDYYYPRLDELERCGVIRKI